MAPLVAALLGEFPRANGLDDTTARALAFLAWETLTRRHAGPNRWSGEWVPPLLGSLELAWKGADVLALAGQVADAERDAAEATELWKRATRYRSQLGGAERASKRIAWARGRVAQARKELEDAEKLLAETLTAAGPGAEQEQEQDEAGALPLGMNESQPSAAAD